MKESKCEFLRDYVTFKKELLYCLLVNDGLGLLQSQIFDMFQLKVFGSALHQSQSSGQALPHQRTQLDRTWKLKAVQLDQQTTLNIVEQSCLSERGTVSRPYRDTTYYQDKIEQLNDTIAALKNENLREFVHFQNALLIARSQNQRVSHSQRKLSNCKTPPPYEPGELSLTSSTPEKQSQSSRKHAQLTADDNECSANNQFKTDDECDLPLQLNSRQFQSSINDLSEIMFQIPVPLLATNQLPSINDRLTSVFRATLAAHGYDYQACQEMPLFSSLYANIQSFLVEEINPSNSTHGIPRPANCQNCAEYALSSVLRSVAPQTKRQLQEREKQIGKRQLVLIVKEKGLAERKVELQLQQEELNLKRENFMKDIQQRISAFEQQKLELEERTRNLKGQEQALQRKELEWSFSVLNADQTNDSDMYRRKLDLLKQKVRFEEIKRQACYSLGQESEVLQNVLPGLRSLHARMKGATHEMSAIPHT